MDGTEARIRRGWRAWPWKRFRLIAILSGVVALVLAAGAGGWWVANQTLVASYRDGEPEAVTTAEAVDLTVTMPDVRGLAQDDAIAVLADSGIGAASVQVEEAPSALPTGTVVGQVPAFGATLPDRVVLRIAVPATVPDLVGVSRDDAVQELLALGTTPDLTFAYDRTAVPGTVLGSSPGAGEPLASEVQVTVATAGSTLPLSEVGTIGRTCTSLDDVEIVGKDAPSSLVCEVDDQARQTTWQTAGLVDRLTATLGIDDTSAPGSSARVEILADGVPVFDQTASFGSVVQIDVDLPAPIQLTMRVTPSAPTRVVLASAVLYGSETAIDDLGAR